MLGRSHFWTCRYRLLKELGKCDVTYYALTILHYISNTHLHSRDFPYKHSGSVESTLQEMFTQPEILRVSEGNGWRPSKNADKVDAYKGSSLKLDGLPSLLQLHLKRFKYDWETGETSKINDCCSFPMVSGLFD